MIDHFIWAPSDKKPSESDIRAAFDKLDTDGSGALELAELVPLVKGIITDMINAMWGGNTVYDLNFTDFGNC